MAYTWLKRRGKVFHLYFAQSLGRKPFSLKTTDKAAALEVWHRTESEFWACAHGIKRKSVERLRYFELVQKFIEHKEAAAVNPQTLSTYLRTCNAFGAFLQSDLFLDSITPEHVEKYVAHRRASLRHCGTGTLKPKSIRNEAGVLACLFKWAVDRDLLLENPMRRVAMPQRVVYDNQRALAPAEYVKLRGQIGESFRDILDLYLLTGLRRSDGISLTSENFNFETQTATFFQSKTQRHKTLPMSKDLVELVSRMIGRVGVGRALIHVQPSALTVNFRKARIRAGLPESITFHSLRHTFASWLAQAGVDFKTLQSLTGHKSSQALEIYLHSFDPNRRSAIEKLTLPRKAVNE